MLLAASALLMMLARVACDTGNELGTEGGVAVAEQLGSLTALRELNLSGALWSLVGIEHWSICVTH